MESDADKYALPAFLVIFFLAIAGNVALWYFLAALRKSFPDVYVSLGSPPIFWPGSPKQSGAIVSYIVQKKFMSLPSRKFQMAGIGLRTAFLLYVVLLALTLLFFVAHRFI